jgi:hypothetical protein
MLKSDWSIAKSKDEKDVIKLDREKSLPNNSSTLPKEEPGFKKKKSIAIPNGSDQPHCNGAQK